MNINKRVRLTRCLSFLIPLRCDYYRHKDGATSSHIILRLTMSKGNRSLPPSNWWTRPTNTCDGWWWRISWNCCRYFEVILRAIHYNGTSVKVETSSLKVSNVELVWCSLFNARKIDFKKEKTLYRIFINSMLNLQKI